MKIPQRAPTLSQLLPRLLESRKDIMDFLSKTYPEKNYFSYDDLKYRPLPDFAKNRDELWLKLLMQRQGRFKQLPLEDQNGIPFQFFIEDSDWEILHELDLQGGGIIQVASPVPNAGDTRRYLISSLMEESIASSLLEGAPTTREKAKEMLRQNRPPKNEGERMVLNNYRTMQKLKEWQDEPLSPELIFRIHQEISEGTISEEQANRFRKPDEDIVVGDDFGTDFYVPPPANLLPERIQRLCDFANTDHGTPFLHPVVKAIILHFWLAYEHPFCDGNGRTARALFYWFLLKTNYWACEYISISTVIKKSGMRYYKAFLNSEYNGNDMNYFIKFHLEMLKRAIDEFLKYVRKKQAEQIFLQESFGNLALMNPRQRLLLETWIKKPHIHPSISVLDYQNEHKVSRETARQDLSELAEKGFAGRIRNGRSFVFVASKDLKDKLSGKT